MKEEIVIAVETLRRKLAAAIARFAGTAGVHQTVLPGLRLSRRDGPTTPTALFYSPALTLVAQGAKEVQFAGRSYTYDQAHYLLTSFDLPVSSRVSTASREMPFLCLSLELDLKLAGELMVEMPALPTQPAGSGLAVSRIDEALLDAALRLVGLLDAPRDLPALAPLIVREIHYRLLVGSQGARLRHLAVAGSQSQQIARIVAWVKRHYSGPVRVAALARMAGMSVSSLHHHFKEITGLSPLQYQKQLRLQEARRLLLTGCDAAEAGHRVGYESPSQFSRDYRRVFGAPPLRDTALIRRHPVARDFSEAASR